MEDQELERPRKSRKLTNGGNWVIERQEAPGSPSEAPAVESTEI